MAEPTTAPALPENAFCPPMMVFDGAFCAEVSETGMLLNSAPPHCSVGVWSEEERACVPPEKKSSINWATALLALGGVAAVVGIVGLMATSGESRAKNPRRRR